MAIAFGHKVAECVLSCLVDGRHCTGAAMLHG